MNNNFQPMIKCPACGKTNHPEISGWGGELSTRIKACRHCGIDYRLLVYSFADLDTENTTALIHNHIDRIRHLKKRISEKLLKLSNKNAEWAEEFMRVERSTGGKQN